MQLLELITSSSLRSVSVVGLAKNAGKTVALNSLIRQANAKGITLGLSSVGYDGEKVDLVSRLAKPRIEVAPGTLLATAVATLERATASLEILSATNFFTALGEVLLVRSREGGRVEIAGPDSYSEMGLCLARLAQLGSKLVLLDGALDRIGGAAPTLTEAAVLATGAVVGGSLDRILSRTLHAVGLFGLPEVSDEKMQAGASLAMQSGLLHLLVGQELRALPFSSALGHAAAVADSLPQDVPCALVIPGAITENLLTELAARPRLCRNTRLICKDPTHIFALPEVWQKYVGRGGRVEVLKNISLLAVTVNPTAPRGKSYAPVEFANEIAAALHPLPVYDLFLSDERVGY